MEVFTYLKQRRDNDAELLVFPIFKPVFNCRNRSLVNETNLNITKL